METTKTTLRQSYTFANNYADSSDRFLEDVYGRCSKAKQNAYASIMYEMWIEDGHDVRICTHNTMTFTMAYQLGDDLIYHTPSYRYIVKDWKQYL